MIAAGKKPMGRPPVPMNDSTRVLRARRVVRNAEEAERLADEVGDRTTSETKRLPKVVANNTDPQSRIMPTRRGFLQGYNAQVAVSNDQLIIAVHLGQSTNDQACFLSMMRAAQNAAARVYAATGNTDHVIGTVLADAGAATRILLPQARIGSSRWVRNATRPALGQKSPPTGRHRPMRPHARPTDTGCARQTAERCTSGEVRVEPAIGNLKKSSTGSRAAAWTMRPANCTWQPPRSTS